MRSSLLPSSRSSSTRRIKRYSSGMAVRLGFSIATSVDANILIVDEVLAVGDLAFQRKCFDRMEDMIKRAGQNGLAG